MTTITFDSLDYFEKLKDAGFTEKQAKVQADVMRQQTEAQRVALQTALDRYDETSRKDLATRGDLQDVRLEIEKVRKEIRETELRLIKWQLGIAAGIVSVMLTGFGALVAIMAKGFGWLGF